MNLQNLFMKRQKEVLIIHMMLYNCFIQTTNQPVTQINQQQPSMTLHFRLRLLHDATVTTTTYRPAEGISASTSHTLQFFSQCTKQEEDKCNAFGNSFCSVDYTLQQTSSSQYSSSQMNHR